jgi:HD-GYP domain-containing protein (c-di-GMP phosphodiesterase class II)
MNPATPASAWHDVAQARPLSSQKRFRVPAQHLRLGMFVAELDRPWLDTPFLIQGFLVDSAIELSTLRKYCHHVYVDLEQSSPEAAAAVRECGRFDDPLGSQWSALGPAAAQPVPARPRASPPADRPSGPDADDSGAAAPASNPAPQRTPTAGARTAGRTYRPRADVKITSDTRARFRQLVRSQRPSEHSVPEASLAQRAMARLKTMLGSGVDGSEADGASGPWTEIRKSLPADSTICAYVDRHSVAEEMPRARQALACGEETLAQLAAELRAGRTPEFGRIEDVVGRIVDSTVDNPDALMWAVQMREEHLLTCQQGVRVALLMVALGRQLGLPRGLLGHLGMIGMLADVGKVRLPRALLDKPGLLNPAEYSIVKEHVRLGLEALGQGMKLAPEIEAGIAQHHERLDGSGYPKGLKDEEISLYGRIAGIADSYAALVTPRAYANPLAPQDALMNLYQWAGTSFHAPLVEQFVQAIGVFPVGSLVELSTGEVSVVLAQNRLRRLQPRVLMLTWPDKRALPVPIERDLFQPPRDADSKPVRIVRGLPSGAFGLRLRDYYAAAAEPA